MAIPMKLIKVFKSIYFKIFFSNLSFAKKIGVKVGKNCRIYTRFFGSEPFLISIGDNVTVTAGVRFITHDGSGCLVKDKNLNRFYSYAPIEIGNNIFIGVNSIILPGVRIGDNSIIAAGTVVNKSIPPGSIVGGNPVKFITTFEKFSNKVLNEWISYDNLNLKLEYKNRILSNIDFSTCFKDELRK